MTFFCAQCQTRHDVRDISADMWSICRDNLKEGIKSRFLELIKESDTQTEGGNPLFDLYNDLLGFIQTPEPQLLSNDGTNSDIRINAFFALNPGNLRQLSDVHAEGGIVTGTYSFRLGTLLNLYSRWNMANYSIGDVPAEWYDAVMYQQKLKLFFGDNGVLDKVTDMENVPFPQDDQMLGFVHICPHCGRVLSRASGCAEEIVVALAGAPRAGKTACMVSMLSSLLNGTCPGIRIIPMAHDDKWADLNTEIEFFNQGMKVEKTPDKITEVPAHSILVQMNDRNRTQRVLTIVDMPGEFWQGTSGLTPEFFKKYSGIYENIDCIWFVISKATVCLSHVSSIPADVQDKLSKDLSEDADIIKNSAPQNLSINLSMLSSQLQKPMPPIMVIVSKPDYSITELDTKNTQTYKLFPDEFTDVASCNAEELMRVLKTDSQLLYGINQYPLYEHAVNVRSFIKETCPSFLSAIEDNCPDRFYASVSPYGHPAIDRTDFSMSAPTPYHELLPFIWTLSIQSGLQIYQDCKWLKRNILKIMSSEEHTRELVSYRCTSRVLPVPRGGRGRQLYEDRNRVYAAISNNLLMNGKAYIAEVTFEHERA